MSRGLLRRLLRGLAPWVAALVAMFAAFAGLRAVAEWRASTAVAEAEEQAAEERALREAQVGEAADGEGYWGPAYAAAQEAGIDLALDGVEPMTEDTVPSLLRALRDTEVDAAEEIRLDAESSIVTGREAGGSVRELWFEADSAPRASEAAGHRRSSGAHLDLESLEHFSLEDVVAQAREYEPDAGLGISYVRIYGGTGDVETHGEFGSLVDVSFEGSYSAVTMRLDDLERLD